MNRKNINNEIYKMYEEEVTKLNKANKVISNLKLEVYSLKSDLTIAENKINKEIEKATKTYKEENNLLKSELIKALNEIDRLKSQLTNDNTNNEKDYKIDKLTNQVNKNSTNSGIPTSKEIGKSKTGVNTYNHRTKSSNKTGGQFGHKGNTLTKEKLKKIIEENNLEVKQKVYYIEGSSKEKDIIKYRIGIKVNLYVEELVFKHRKKSKEKLPKEYYSDVTYSEEVKALVVTLGNYYSLGYSKVQEIIHDLSGGIINISEGTVDNNYEEFFNKSEGTINNITKNLLNGKYQHTDETTTSENGKETYYRGYANPYNVLYKYHHHKGDKPIEEDDILTKYYGTIISDHEVGIFKYGTFNQDCVIHTGRYCIEGEQNILETEWQMIFYRFLLKLERERKILVKFGKTSFNKEEIRQIEKEYDTILKIGEKQNKEIASTYWKEKEETLLRRLKKYKKTTLFFIYDFDIPYDNNFIERALRMIKGKTKISGGFRSSRGGERFGNIMSVIKTAKLRKLNPLTCIKEIYEGKDLFA